MGTINSTKEGTQMKTAHETYLDKHAEAMAKIEKIKAMLETHSMKEANDKRNWGFSGDLGHWNQLLGQILGEKN